jgi:hypothetical protein
MKQTGIHNNSLKIASTIEVRSPYTRLLFSFEAKVVLNFALPLNGKVGRRARVMLDMNALPKPS